MLCRRSGPKVAGTCCSSECAMGSNHCKCESCEEFEADFPGVLVPTELVIPQKAFGDTAAEDDTQDTAEDDAAFTQGDSAFIQASVGSLSKHTGPGHCACHCQGEDLRFQGGPLGVKGEGLDLELTPLEFGRDNELVHREVSPLLLALDAWRKLLKYVHILLGILFKVCFLVNSQSREARPF
ncbi:unnamed protein product [Durusdinium trenchii]|uniref:Metallothionein n=1 Tax=Durusdinium trenchii TaxID=1381693 RepID=A0ABP0LIX7_9DINO